jgi:hypothetical protein
MEEGMGMLRSGSATSDSNGPSIGRGMSADSTLERATSNGPLSQKDGNAAQRDMTGMAGMQMHMEKAEVSKDANTVPGFPQDAYMEGQVMAMDDLVQKPETYGLRPGWTGFMMGMMTLLRVLPPDQYDHIQELCSQKKTEKIGTMPGT